MGVARPPAFSRRASILDQSFGKSSRSAVGSESRAPCRCALRSKAGRLASDRGVLQFRHVPGRALFVQMRDGRSSALIQSRA